MSAAKRMRSNQVKKGICMPAALLIALFLTFPSLAAGTDALPLIRVKVPQEAVEGQPERILCPDMTYRTFDPEEDPLPHFVETVTVGETEYVIKSTSGGQIRGKEPAARHSGSYRSAPFSGDGKDHLPESVKEFDGIRMELVSCELLDCETEPKTEEKSVVYDYTAVEEGTEIPEKQVIDFTDESTGDVFSRELPLISSEVVSEYWSDTFQFPVHITGFDADVFDLGGVDVPADASLVDYAGDFLRVLSLDPAFYEITDIVWSGEPYTDEDGRECRDAVASGRKLLKDVSCVYAGEVTFPSVPAKAWQCEYQEILPEEKSYIYTMTADLHLVRRDIAEKTAGDEDPAGGEQDSTGRKGWIRAVYEGLAKAVGKIGEFLNDHPAESVISLLAFAGFLIFLLTRKARCACIYDGKVKCPHDRRTKEQCESCIHRYQAMKE